MVYGSKHTILISIKRYFRRTEFDVISIKLDQKEKNRFLSKKKKILIHCTYCTKTLFLRNTFPEQLNYHCC